MSSSSSRMPTQTIRALVTATKIGWKPTRRSSTTSRRTRSSCRSRRRTARTSTVSSRRTTSTTSQRQCEYRRREAREVDHRAVRTPRARPQRLERRLWARRGVDVRLRAQTGREEPDPGRPDESANSMKRRGSVRISGHEAPDLGDGQLPERGAHLQQVERRGHRPMAAVREDLQTAPLAQRTLLSSVAAPSAPPPPSISAGSASATSCCSSATRSRRGRRGSRPAGSARSSRTS